MVFKTSLPDAFRSKIDNVSDNIITIKYTIFFMLILRKTDYSFVVRFKISEYSQYYYCINNYTDHHYAYSQQSIRIINGIRHYCSAVN